MIETEKIMVAGDWHGNTRWGVNAIREGCRRLDSDTKIILQLGDFGLWTTGREFLNAVSDECEKQGAEFFWIDGNHEDHALLARRREGKPHEPVELVPHVWHMPRGWRWKWHGREWLALGGAASVDRAFRTEGHSWFAEEEITLLQAATVVMMGPADVMITHECPRKVTQHLPLGEPMAGWDVEVSRSHQELLDRIIGYVEPSYLFHGHMHIAHQGVFTYAHGKVQVRGLNCDGRKDNWAILNTKLMAWEEEP